MEYDKNICPVVGVDGFVSAGKQFDVDIHLPEDNRSVIYGVIKDCYEEPIKDAVVKLIEVDRDCKKTERKPVTHTFTDKFYEIEIWANKVKHSKICTTSKHHGKCLKGEKLDCDCNEYFDKREEDVEE